MSGLLRNDCEIARRARRAGTGEEGQEPKQVSPTKEEGPGGCSEAEHLRQRTRKSTPGPDCNPSGRTSTRFQQPCRHPDRPPRCPANPGPRAHDGRSGMHAIFRFHNTPPLRQRSFAAEVSKAESGQSGRAQWTFYRKLRGAELQARRQQQDSCTGPVWSGMRR